MQHSAIYLCTSFNSNLYRFSFLLYGSDEVFGTGDDPVNLKSALEECSWNQLTVLPGIGDPNEVADATGVIQVDIGISLEGNTRGTIRNAVTTAVQNKLGHSLPGPYKYVLYSLEKCYQDCGWAAYAYINSWNSVYQGVYYKHPGVLVHEVSREPVICLEQNSILYYGISN